MQLSLLSPTGPAELRWRNHHARYVLPAGPLFDPRRHRVDRIDETAARAFCAEHHYLGASFPAAVACWGLWRDTGNDEELAGVAVLSVPAHPAVLTNVFDPDLAAPYRETAELGRFCLLEEVEHNGESWTLRHVLSDAAAAGYRGVVAFSDPQPRLRSDGTVAFRGHHGGVYSGALGAPYLGRTRRSWQWVHSPSGQVLGRRALAKLERLETGHRYVEARLVAAGATPRGDVDPKLWLPGALDAAGYRRQLHRGQHRFAFALGSRRLKAKLTARWEPQPRPTHLDPL